MTKEEFEKKQINRMKSKINFNHTYLVTSDGNIKFFDSANAKYEDDK